MERSESFLSEKAPSETMGKIFIAGRGRVNKYPWTFIREKNFLLWLRKQSTNRKDPFKMSLNNEIIFYYHINLVNAS